jgi:hypothetical protein
MPHVGRECPVWCKRREDIINEDGVEEWREDGTLGRACMDISPVTDV